MKRTAAFGLIALAGAAADLLSKHLAFVHIPHGGADIRIIDGLFSFGRTYNKGIVFGIGQGAGPVFLVVSVLAVPAIAAIYFSLRKPTWVVTSSLGLILGGTIGNMIDRVVFGHVRDFIKFYWQSHVWPLFNIADSCICVGVALLTLEMLFFDEKKKKDGPSPTHEDPIQAGPGAPAGGASA